MPAYFSATPSSSDIIQYSDFGNINWLARSPSFGRRRCRIYAMMLWLSKHKYLISIKLLCDMKRIICVSDFDLALIILIMWTVQMRLFRWRDLFRFLPVADIIIKTDNPLSCGGQQFFVENKNAVVI